MWHIIWLLLSTTFGFYLIDFLLNTDFPSQVCVFYRKMHLTLLKDRFHKKMQFKEEQDPVAHFPAKL